MGAMHVKSPDRLTDRKRSVQALICKGFQNPEIAAHLGISRRAVKECVSQLLLIYEVSNRTELAGFCGQQMNDPPPE